MRTSNMQAAVLFGCVCGLTSLGCGGGSDSGPTAASATPKPEKPPAVETATQQAEVEPVTPEKGVGTKLKQAFSGFQKGAEGVAGDVSDFAGKAMDGFSNTGGQATEAATEFVTNAYQTAKEKGETEITNARDWVMDDLKKGGAWEYKVLTLTDAGAADAEEQLNNLGSGRWECYAVVPVGATRTYHFKRPVRSMIRNLPAKELLRLLPLLGGDDE